MTGRLLIFVSCAAMGIGAACSLKKEERGLCAALTILTRAETLVIYRMLPWPEVIRTLHGELPQWVTSDTDSPWNAADLGEQGSALLRAFSAELHSGAEPSGAFSRAKAEASAARDRLADKVRSSARLYSAGGILTGSLLVILLW